MEKWQQWVGRDMCTVAENVTTEQICFQLNDIYSLKIFKGKVNDMYVTH